MSTSSTLYKCSVPQCDFVGSTENSLKAHRVKTHVMKVKVRYSQPDEALLVHRTNDCFNCARCPFKSPYPTVLQKHARESCVRKQDPIAPLQHPVITDSSPISLAKSLSPMHESFRSSSPEELPNIKNSDYSPIPDDKTIVHHPPFDLPALGIVINLRFQCIVCFNCGRAIDSSSVIQHIRKHIPLLQVPAELPLTLESAYELIPYSDAVYIPGPIQPVFGIPLEEGSYFFCDCGLGYGSYDHLRSHQTRKDDRECTLRKRKPGFHMGYGQRLTKNRPIFEVQLDNWRLVSEDDDSYPIAYRQSLPPLRDYTSLEIQGAEDDMNTSSFFYTQRWLDHLKGFTPQDIVEVCKQATPEAPWGVLLREVGLSYLMDAKLLIRKHNAFGLLKLMGQTTERETLHRFDPISDASIQKYSLTLHRLIFGVLRQIDPMYSHKYRYPALDPIQLRP